MRPLSGTALDPGEAELRSRSLRRWSSNASLTVATLLAAAKILAWLATDSLSLLASVVDALVDIFASLVTFFGIRFSLQPPDAEHRFGHGKAESLAALTQAMLLVGAVAVLIVDGVQRLIVPLGLSQLNLGLGVIAGSTALTACLVLFESYVERRTQSQAVAADRAHHLSDIVANLAVLLALALTKWTGWQLFDPLFAIGIAAFFAWTAFGIARSALQALLDHELPTAERQQISRVVMTHSSARGLHDLRTRRSGPLRFIEFHLELDGGLSLQEAHTIADDIECSVKKALPLSEVIVHVEPGGIRDERLDDRIKTGHTG
jgi:ferrous-iron efflux pump FieF